MAETFKILGQAAPTATTNVDLYTVPAGKQAVISTLVVANRSGSTATYRIAARSAGEALADKNYIAFDVPVSAADSTTLTLGMSLSATDIVTVYASTSSLSFTAFGSESDV